MGKTEQTVTTVKNKRCKFADRKNKHFSTYFNNSFSEQESSRQHSSRREDKQEHDAGNGRVYSIKGRDCRRIKATVLSQPKSVERPASVKPKVDHPRQSCLSTAANNQLVELAAPPVQPIKLEVVQSHVETNGEEPRTRKRLFSQGVQSITAVITNNKHIKRRESKAFITIFIVIILFVFFRGFFIVSTVVDVLCEGCVNDQVYVASYWWFWMKSSVNPFIYAFISSEFRRYCLQVISTRACMCRSYL